MISKNVDMIQLAILFVIDVLVCIGGFGGFGGFVDVGDVVVHDISIMID